NYYASSTPLPDWPTDKDVYFGPAMRSGVGAEKSNILGSCALWVDVDDLERPLCTFPPSALVFSGHGWHLYWFLNEPVTDIELLESLNKVAAADVPTADAACWNANRVLRVPGTLNRKDASTPVQVELRALHPELRYSQSDMQVLARLDPKTRHKTR
ncbi:MAG: hypothetical protein COS67_08670, partial [Deltaproteobacteria bacterium CG06_land_8_20_14_3_00_44_19]